MAPVFPALIKAFTSFCLSNVIPFTRDESGLVLTIVELLSFILTLSVVFMILIFLGIVSLILF